MTGLPELAEALRRGDPPETLWPILRALEPAPLASVSRTEREVREAALWLDAKLPGWWTRVNLARLDMVDPEWCICAQTVPRWRWVKRMNAWRKLEAQFMRETGARSPVGAFVGGGEIWKREIIARRAQA